MDWGRFKKYAARLQTCFKKKTYFKYASQSCNGVYVLSGIALANMIKLIMRETAGSA